MEDNCPLVTIIVATLNSRETVGRCIKSVCSQVYPRKELIVMDGGSTDGTIEILKDNDDRIASWKSEADSGIYHAWNKALQYAHGEWICFLGADDYFWNDRVLADLSPHLTAAAKSHVKVVYGQAARVDREGRIHKLFGKPWEKISWLMPHGMPLPHTGLMHHRSLFEEHGLFDDSYHIAGDYELLLRELKTGQARYVRGLIVAAWQSGGVSDYKFLSAHREMARARRHHGFSRPSWVWLAVHIRGIVREYWRRIIRK